MWGKVGESLVMKSVYCLLRVLILAVLAVILAPLLIVAAIILFAFGPKVAWPNYWANLLSDATRSAWHWVFGPPKVDLARKR